jgi:hypothetical protein
MAGETASSARRGGPATRDGAGEGDVAKLVRDLTDLRDGPHRDRGLELGETPRRRREERIDDLADEVLAVLVAHFAEAREKIRVAGFARRYVAEGRRLLH